MTAAPIAYRNNPMRYPTSPADSKPSWNAARCGTMGDPSSARMGFPDLKGSSGISRGRRGLYRLEPNPGNYATLHDRPRRVGCEEIGQVVPGETRLRDPGPPGPLDHGGPEEGEPHLPPVRRVLRPGTGEHGDLLHREGREEGGSGPPEARRRLHDADDEGRLGHLRDVQGPRRERVLHPRGMRTAQGSCRLASVRTGRRWTRRAPGSPWSVASRVPSASRRPRLSSRRSGAGGAAPSPSSRTRATSARTPRPSG